jgi:signal transduction histidine kinase
VEDGLASLTVRAVFEDSTGVAWVGGDRKGISRITDQGIERLSIEDDPRANDIRAISEAPDGSIWFGTYGRGLARYADGELKPIDFLREDIIFSIVFEPDGAAWIGGEDGLYRYAADGSIRAVATKKGLDGAVFQILDDRLGSLWLCTNRGVVRLNRQALLDGVETGPMRFFDNNQGMRSRQCNGATQPAGWRAKNGSLWFPMANGVSRVDPGRMLVDSRAPPVVIQDVRVDDRIVKRNAEGLVEIPSGARRIEIDYAALTFIAPNKVSYRYYLEGHDDDWVNPGSLGTAFYNDLPPGQYTFRVTAANADGAQADVDASLTVVQLPKIYQAFWFKGLMLVFAVLLMVGYWRWRSRELRRRNAELRHLVEERTKRLSQANADLERMIDQLNATHDRLLESQKLASLGALVAGVAHEVNTPVGNSLTIATHLWERCEPLTSMTDSAIARGEVERFRKGLEMIQTNLERAGRVVASFKRIDVAKDDSQRRRFKLCEVLSDARLGLVQQIQTKGHTLEVECPEDLEMDSFPESIYELLTQLTVNSLQHAFPSTTGTIRISARQEGDQIELDYRDDGIGIDPVSRDRLFDPFFTSRRGSHAGLGMHIVYNIATQLLGGEVYCGDGPGAHFRILIPVTTPSAAESDNDD